MYRDFGAAHWFFEIDETNGPQLWSRLEEVHRDPNAARARVAAIMNQVRERQRRMVAAARSAAGMA